MTPYHRALREGWASHRFAGKGRIETKLRMCRMRRENAEGNGGGRA